jgi:hypothetical protein
MTMVMMLRVKVLNIHLLQSVAWTLAASMGENASNADRTMSYAASGSVAGFLLLLV